MQKRTSPKAITINGRSLATIIEMHGAWLDGNDGEQASLMRADLSGVDLSGVRLDRADLRMADLSNSKMVKTSLIEACLIGANLDSANTDRADMRCADLRCAQLANSKWTTADQQGPNTHGANFKSYLAPEPVEKFFAPIMGRDLGADWPLINPTALATAAE